MSYKVIVTLAFSCLACSIDSRAETARVSSFGHYTGYETETFDSYERHSQYVTARDGTQLAVDYFLPTKNGNVVRRRFPAIFQMTPYLRAYLQGGILHHRLNTSPVQAFNPYLELSRNGYAIVVADVRGQGASFGGNNFGIDSAEEARDGYDLIKWLARQPWSNGQVGMLGNSYAAETQFLVASEKPPALKAIFPCHSTFDLYSNAYHPGGLQVAGILEPYNAKLKHLGGIPSENPNEPVSGFVGGIPSEDPNELVEGPEVVPVDGPTGEDLLLRAKKEHARLNASDTSDTFIRQQVSQQFRDQDAVPMIRTESGPQNMGARLKDIQEARIPTYNWGGWNDFSPDSALSWYANGPKPQKVTVGPWTHSPTDMAGDPRSVEDQRLVSIEALRWFDRWLKNIHNGVETEPTVHYAIQIGGHYSARDASHGYTDGKWYWQAAASWPPPLAKPLQFFLSEGPSKSVNSANDGRLLLSASSAAGVDTLVIDSHVTTGPRGRLAHTVGAGALQYPNMAADDERSLTYTTPPLEENLTVVGAPVVTLFLRSTETDAAVIGWLEEVDSTGYSTLVTYGSLKGSHRKLGTPPYKTHSPWPTSLRADVEHEPPLSSGIAVLTFPLLPTGTQFSAGNRIRLTIAGADEGNLEAVSHGGKLAVYRDASHRSSITIPTLISSQGLGPADR